ncbi:MAG: thioesterase domain-containing protein, partial [Acidobacteriota bacterium]|nr:thioesterase domain-containing protein [Acidobacteriota bacterium]
MTSTLATSPWLTLPKSNPHANMRLFCFPYAGGGVHVFRAWADNLPKTVEVCPIQLPGRGARMREAAFTQMAPLVYAAAEAML